MTTNDSYLPQSLTFNCISNICFYINLNIIILFPINCTITPSIFSHLLIAIILFSIKTMLPYNVTIFFCLHYTLYEKFCQGFSFFLNEHFLY